jgi:serine/threonine protein kinase
MDLSGVNAPNSAENHKQRIRQPSIANRLRSDVRHARPVIKETYLKTEVEDVPKNTKHIQFLQKGTKVLLKSYTFVKNLGEGGFGEVKEYIDDTTQKHVALKRVKCNTEEAFGNAYREVSRIFNF